MRVGLADALGAVTAADIVAPISLPGFDNSAMDGFAVRAADVAGAAAASPVTMPVAADIPAGRTDIPTLAPGTAIRIMTGAPVPPGADAVVPVEATDADFTVDAPIVEGTAVTITAPSDVGKHIRRAGSDIDAGALVLPAGTVIGAAAIGVFAALGLTEIPVWRRLRVAVLSTGSELVEPGKPLQPGQIYESNGIMLTAAATEAGALARHEHFVPDDPAAFLARLDRIAADTDLIITSGGVSAGAFEVVKEALSTSPRADIEFVKVAMQPGMPQGSGHYRRPDGVDVALITLPGNPVSSLVSFEVFIREPLRLAMGLTGGRRRFRARIDTDLTSPAGKRQYRRGVFVGPPAGVSGDVVSGDMVSGADADTSWITPIGPPASHHLSNLARAQALVDVPADVVALRVGDEVDVIELRD